MRRLALRPRRRPRRRGGALRARGAARPRPRRGSARRPRPSGRRSSRHDRRRRRLRRSSRASSRQRFAILSTEMALALSSAILQPASTTGHSGFAVDLEVATVAGPRRPDRRRPTAGFTNERLADASRRSRRSSTCRPSTSGRRCPSASSSAGASSTCRASSYFAAQGEAKWALNEGFEYVPDLAVRVAYTRLFGQKDWNLGATDVDFLVSKRWGVNGGDEPHPLPRRRASRYVSASTERIDFAPTRPAAATNPVGPATNTQASFPRFAAGFYRTTLGAAVHRVLGVARGSRAPTSAARSPKVSGYDGVKIASSLGGAAKLGWEF